MNENFTNDILATVIYEPNNKSQQALIIQDYKSGKRKEFHINDSLILEKDNGKLSLSKLLNENNFFTIYKGVVQKENVSFILNAEEIRNLARHGINVVEKEGSI